MSLGFCGVLFIQFVYIGGGLVVRVFKGFRFDPELYGDLRRLVSARGVTVTNAFERFMSVCVESGALVFPECGVGGF